MKRAPTPGASSPRDPGGVILAVDGGGTRTRCVAAARTGRVLGVGVSGPANVVQCGRAEVKRHLLAASRAALADAGTSADRVRAVSAGLAGVFPDGRNREPAARILRGAFRRARLGVTGDAVIALRGAIPEGRGVVALSGTGSSVYGASPGTGASVRVGGGGPLLGDEGSGYRIALAGLHAAWQACDGRGEPTALAPRLARALGIHRFEASVDVLYGEGMGRDRIAALAEVVIEAAARGDVAALGILRKAGQALGHAAAVAARNLKMKGRVAVSYQGALFESAESLLDAFSDAVRAECPDAGVRAPALPPVGGAFLLGLEALGEKATADVHGVFAQGIRERWAGAAPVQRHRRM